MRCGALSSLIGHRWERDAGRGRYSVRGVRIRACAFTGVLPYVIGQPRAPLSVCACVPVRGCVAVRTGNYRRVRAPRFERTVVSVHCIALYRILGESAACARKVIVNTRSIILHHLRCYFILVLFIRDIVAAVYGTQPRHVTSDETRGQCGTVYGQTVDGTTPSTHTIMTLTRAR